MSLVIFDVCWTMYKSNTTFDFIKFVYKTENIKSFILILLNSQIVKIILLLLGKILGRDIYRELFVGLLQDFTRRDIEILSEKFYKDFLLKKKIDYTFDIFEKINTDEILLCSASLDVVVAHIANELNVDFFASELEFKNGVCTGKICKDLLGVKDQILEKQKNRACCYR
ncbi:haloacid dehalogenase-like hydrolase [Acinetobacter sp. P8-3-8]|uniref:haloacid dehalogenase-like hydrolase n=1 Tax=Acinetobacter sp. P8-3-8 TaxID=1029823 RepID=UPI0002485B36|nr:haloacid dehalogenase-like hydrolase [Acinetobacter sp. P8-3-8]